MRSPLSISSWLFSIFFLPYVTKYDLTIVVPSTQRRPCTPTPSQRSPPPLPPTPSAWDKLQKLKQRQHEKREKKPLADLYLPENDITEDVEDSDWYESFLLTHPLCLTVSQLRSLVFRYMQAGQPSRVCAAQRGQLPLSYGRRVWLRGSQ
jgi:hypothetical protein